MGIFPNILGIHINSNINVTDYNRYSNYFGKFPTQSFPKMCGIIYINMNPFDQIALNTDSFTKSEQKIKDHILNDPEVIVFYPLVEAANRIKVSKSALLRFCQKCGYNGYSEFKYEISRLFHSGQLYSSSYESKSSEMIDAYCDAMLEIKNRNLDQVFDDISHDLIKSTKIRIFGVHESGLPAHHLQYRLSTLGIDADYVEPTLSSEKAIFGTSSDLHIYFSLSGKTMQIEEALPNSFEKKSKTILITQNDRVKFKSHVTHFILVPSLNSKSTQAFLDAQLLNFLIVELIASNLSKHLSKDSI